MKKNRILYASLFILSLIFVYFYGGKIPYMLFYVVILLPFISIAFTLIAYARFKFVEDIDKRIVVKNENINYKFSIYNNDLFLYPYITINFYGCDTLFSKQFQTRRFSLLPLEKKTYSFDLACKYRGDYMVGVKTIEFEDYLGIFKIGYAPEITKTITVHPQLVKLDNLYIRTNYLSESHSILNKQYEDITTISDTRKYAYGDSLKKIHWKLSAKMNELLVKNFEGTSKTNCVLILDLKKNSYIYEQNLIIEDKLIETTVAIVYYCLLNWIPINLVYHYKDFTDIEAKNTMEFKKIYDALAKVRFDQEVELKDLLSIYTRDNMKKTDLLLFTSNLDYDLYNEIYKTKALGYDVNLIYVSSEALTGVHDDAVKDILLDLPEIGVNTYKVNVDDDIKMVFEQMAG